MIEGMLRRDRVLVVCALLAVIVLSWGYLLAGAGIGMHEMDGMKVYEAPTLRKALDLVNLANRGPVPVD